MEQTFPTPQGSVLNEDEMSSELILVASQFSQGAFVIHPDDLLGCIDSDWQWTIT